MWMSSSSGGEREACPPRARARPRRAPPSSSSRSCRADHADRGEHRGVRARLGDVVGPQPPVERERGVDRLEVGVRGCGEARHRAASLRRRRRPSTARRRRATRAISPSRQRGEERQRERARRDVLADRELARRDARRSRGSSSSGGSPGGRACSGRRASRSARIVASRSTRAAARRCTRTSRARPPPARRDTAARAPRCRRAPRRRRPRRGPVPASMPVETLELREADRAGDLAEAVVEAEPVVIEPVHVGCAALVALAVDALLERGVRRA